VGGSPVPFPPTKGGWAHPQKRGGAPPRARCPHPWGLPGPRKNFFAAPLWHVLQAQTKKILSKLFFIQFIDPPPPLNVVPPKLFSKGEPPPPRRPPPTPPHLPAPPRKKKPPPPDFRVKTPASRAPPPAFFFCFSQGGVRPPGAAGPKIGRDLSARPPPPLFLFISTKQTAAPGPESKSENLPKNVPFRGPEGTKLVLPPRPPRAPPRTPKGCPGFKSKAFGWPAPTISVVFFPKPPHTLPPPPLFSPDLCPGVSRTKNAKKKEKTCLFENPNPYSSGGLFFFFFVGLGKR